MNIKPHCANYDRNTFIKTNFTFWGADSIGSFLVRGHSPKEAEYDAVVFRIWAKSDWISQVTL